MHDIICALRSSESPGNGNIITGGNLPKTAPRGEGGKTNSRTNTYYTGNLVLYAGRVPPKETLSWETTNG